MTRYASAARMDGLFEQAKAAWTVQALVESRGGKLRKSGNELRGACILCGAGQDSKSVFSVKAERWKCWACDLGGDVIDLAAELQGLRQDLPAAARWLLGRDHVPRPAVANPAPETPKGPSASARVAEEMWRTARPFAGSLGETYLRRRGISLEVLVLAAERLRFHPAAKHHWDERAADWVRAPAIVLQVEKIGRASWRGRV